MLALGAMTPSQRFAYSVGRVHGRAAQGGRGERHVVHVVLILRVVGEDHGHVALHGEAQRGVAEEKRVVRVDDIGREFVEP